MNFEDAWSSRRTRRLAAAHLRATGPKARSCTAPRVTPHGHPGLRPSLREMFGAVVSGIARHVRLPMKKDSASPIGQSPLPPRLEPETTKPKIGWKMKNVSRSTVPVRLLDFRGHRDVSPFVGAAGHIPHGSQSKSKRSLHLARLQAHDDAGLRGLTKAFQFACNAKTDAANPEATFGSRDRQVAEPHPARPGNDARNAGLRDASSIGAAAGVQVIEGFLDQPIKPTCSIIGDDLAIPSGRIKLRVPSPKRRHVDRRQLLDRGFNFFHGAHGHQYTACGYRRQRLICGLTRAISGSRPWTLHQVRFSRESPALPCSPMGRSFLA